MLRTSGRRAACVAGQLDGAYWLIGGRPGSRLPQRAYVCRPGRGHIVAAARLQLVYLTVLIVYVPVRRTVRHNVGSGAAVGPRNGRRYDVITVQRHFR